MSYQRADGRFSLTARLERPDGTIRRTYFYGRTQAEAKARAAAARDRVSRGEPVRDATRTLSDWLAEWRTTFLRASDRAESRTYTPGLTGSQAPTFPPISAGPVGCGSLAAGSADAEYSLPSSLVFGLRVRFLGLCGDGSCQRLAGSV